MKVLSQWIVHIQRCISLEWPALIGPFTDMRIAPDIAYQCHVHTEKFSGNTQLSLDHTKPHIKLWYMCQVCNSIFPRYMSALFDSVWYQIMFSITSQYLPSGAVWLHDANMSRYKVLFLMETQNKAKIYVYVYKCMKKTKNSNIYVQQTYMCIHMIMIHIVVYNKQLLPLQPYIPPLWLHWNPSIH